MVLKGFSKNQWVTPTFKALLAIFAAAKSIVP